VTAPDAPFRFTQEENVSILVLKQELNNVQWGEIDSIGTQVLNSLAERAHPNVIVDLSQLNYMGSAMVALIVRVWKATMARKGKLAVVCPHEGVREVLKLASLDKHWAITDTQAEARTAVGAGKVSHHLHVDDGSDNKVWKIAAILSTTLLLAIVVGGLIYAFNAGGAGDDSLNEEATEVEEVEVEGAGTLTEEQQNLEGFEFSETPTETPVVTEPVKSEEPPALPPLGDNGKAEKTLPPAAEPDAAPANSSEPAPAGNKEAESEPQE